MQKYHDSNRQIILWPYSIIIMLQMIKDSLRFIPTSGIRERSLFNYVIIFETMGIHQKRHLIDEFNQGNETILLFIVVFDKGSRINFTQSGIINCWI